MITMDEFVQGVLRQERTSSGQASVKDLTYEDRLAQIKNALGIPKAEEELIKQHIRELKEEIAQIGWHSFGTAFLRGDAQIESRVVVINRLEWQLELLAKARKIAADGFIPFHLKRDWYLGLVQRQYWPTQLSKILLGLPVLTLVLNFLLGWPKDLLYPSMALWMIEGFLIPYLWLAEHVFETPMVTVRAEGPIFRRNNAT